MNDILQTLVYGVMLVFAILLWKYRSRGSLVLSPLVVFVLFDVLFNWPSTLYPPPEVQYSPSYGFIATIAFLSFFGTVTIVTCVTPRFRSNFTQFRQSPILFQVARRRLRLVTVILLILSMGIGLLLFQGLPPVTQVLGTMLYGGNFEEATAEVAAGRREITKGHVFGGQYRGQGMLQVAISALSIFALSLAMLGWRQYRTLLWMCLIVVSIIVAFIGIAGSGTRAPFILGILMTFSTISFSRAFKLRSVLLLIFSCFMILMIMSILNHKTIVTTSSWVSSLENASHSIVERILVGNGQNTIYIFDLIQNGTFAHLNGAEHIRTFLAALPGIPAGKPFSYTLFLLRGGSGTTYLTPTYLGVLYLDFGLLGVSIGYGLLGAIIGILENVVVRLRKTPENLVLIGFLSVNAGQMVLSGFLPLFAKLSMIFLVYAAVRVGFALPRLISTGSYIRFESSKITAMRYTYPQR